MSVVKEFREFAVKGNVVDLAVGVIIGGAFGKIVDSLVADIIMPIVGLVFGKLDFSNLYVVLGTVPAGVANNLADLKKAGVPVLAYGNFITIAVNFVILAFIIFMMVKQINRLRRHERSRTGRRARDARRRGAAARNPRQPQAPLNLTMQRPPACGPCEALRSGWTHRPGPFRQCRTPCRDRGWFAPAASPASR